MLNVHPDSIFLSIMIWFVGCCIIGATFLIHLAVLLRSRDDVMCNSYTTKSTCLSYVNHIGNNCKWVRNYMTVGCYKGYCKKFELEVGNCDETGMQDGHYSNIYVCIFAGFTIFMICACIWYVKCKKRNNRDTRKYNSDDALLINHIADPNINLNIDRIATASTTNPNLDIVLDYIEDTKQNTTDLQYKQAVEALHKIV